MYLYGSTEGRLAWETPLRFLSPPPPPGGTAVRGSQVPGRSTVTPGGAPALTAAGSPSLLRLAESRGCLSSLVWIAFHLAFALTAHALDKWCRPVQVKSILTFASGVTGL